MADTAPGTAPVTDHRTAPCGVVPRRMQTWLMLGLALTILAIIMLTGRPEPTPRTAATATAAPAAANPDRLRDYQDRLRVLDERAREQRLDDTAALTATPRPVYDDRPQARAVDPLDAERKRREYESLFASNVVVSRRPEAQRLMADAGARPQAAASPPGQDAVPAPPSIDEVADAVVRASARYAQPSATAATVTPPTPAATSTPTAPGGAVGSPVRPVFTGPITSAGHLHRILEGTLIETVLTNRLDGSVAAPVNCLVTTPIYSHDGRYVLIPAGSRVLGETKPVQTFGETRLAVAFNRLVLPDGRTYRLEQFMGLNDIGDAGLRDQVNQHYRSTFGASAAVGLITGFAQYLGSLGVKRSAGDRTVVIAGNLGDATAQAATQTMSRFLNRLPTITIREGHRVNVYLTSDLELPAYAARDRATRPLLAGVR